MTDEQARDQDSAEAIEDLEAPLQDTDEVSGGNMPTSVEHTLDSAHAGGGGGGAGQTTS